MATLIVEEIKIRRVEEPDISSMTAARLDYLIEMQGKRVQSTCTSYNRIFNHFLN